MVRVAVDQAGHQGGAAQIDDLDGDGKGAIVGHLDDTFAVDNHGRPLAGRAASAIDQTSVDKGTQLGGHEMGSFREGERRVDARAWFRALASVDRRIVPGLDGGVS
jgi:hypothetical protein